MVRVRSRIHLRYSFSFQLMQTTVLEQIFLQDNLPKKSVQEWTLSGKEAEALHLEEEDFSDNEGQGGLSDEEDPLQKIIQSRYCFIVVTCPHMSSVMQTSNVCSQYSIHSAMARKASSSGWNHKKDIIGGGIPDAMAIHMARKKREAAREAGGREDFIPINKDGASRYCFCEEFLGS